MMLMISSLNFDYLCRFGYSNFSDFTQIDKRIQKKGTDQLVGLSSLGYPDKIKMQKDNIYAIK